MVERLRDFLPTVCVMAALALLVTSHCLADTSVPNASSERVLTITDTLLEQHIDPPTRQQMVLSGVKALYQLKGEPSPRGLSRRLSELSNRKELLDYLDEIQTEFGDVDGFIEVLINGMFDAVPGGGGLIDPSESKVQAQLAANRYVGIGIALMMNDQKVPTISKVFYEGPGWKAGVKANDVILEVDQVSTKEKNVSQVVAMLRGEEGSDVGLVVQQPDADPREINVTRGVTFIPTIEGDREDSPGQWRYTLESADDIAFLRVTTIGPSTPHELKKIEAILRDQEIRGVVLDLRFGGGRLHDTVLLADQLLDGGTIGFVRSVDSVTTHTARPGGLFLNLPMVVLLASESNTDRVFLAASLQDQGRAIVIGEATKGETYVNRLLDTSSGDQIRVATGVVQRADGTTLLRPHVSRWTPNTSRMLQFTPKQGKQDEPDKRKLSFVAPDHFVRFGVAANPNDEPQFADAMINKAVEVLRAKHVQADASPPNSSTSG